MEDFSSSIEDDFMDLVKNAPSKAGFMRGAKLMLGEDFEEIGEQIIAENDPTLVKKFLDYFEGEDEE